MGSITTAMATSFKQELFSAGHCFNSTVTPTGNASGTTTSITGVSSMSGVTVGMSVLGTNIAANTFVAAITSSTALTLSLATTGSIATGTLTISGDVFNMALIQGTPTGNYGTGNVNYTDITGASDEVSGSGYSAGGQALANVSAVTSGTTGYITFSANPSWTSATFSSSGCMIYNTSVRDGGTSGTNTTGAGRCCSVHSFGGVQTVTSGTFTVVIPSATSSTALIRIV